MENKQLKFLDLFAGIGGFRFGMESAGHKCVGFAEIDKFARESYKAIHNTEGEIEYHDVTAVTNEQWAELKGKVDIICGGFPCQSFSVAGKRRGFLDDVRGTLFFEIARAAQQIKPRIIFMENVKGLLSHDKGNTFRTILSTLDELGYDAEWEIFNSKNFGVPQNRERVFIIGHLRGERGREIFPFGRKDGKPNEERQIKIVGSTKGAHQTSLGQRDLVYNAEGLIGTLTATDYKQPKVVGIPIKQIGNIDQANRKRKNPHTGRIYDPTGVSPSLSTMQGGGLEPKIIVSDDTVIPVQTPEIANKSQNGRRFKEDGDPMYTLTSKDRHGVAIIQRKRGFNEGGEHEIAPTLSSNSWEQNNLLKVGGVYTNDSPSHNRGILPNTSRTLKSQNHDAGVFDGMRIRKLTPKECWRLQGFPRVIFKGGICYSYAKSVDLNSNIEENEKHVQKDVRISYEGKTLVIRNQEKSFEFANGAVMNESVLPHIQTEDFVVLLAGMLQTRENETLIGMETSSIKASHTNTLNVCKELENNSSKLLELVSAVEKDVKKELNSMPTTRQVLKSNDSDMIYQTLYYFVNLVIQSFMLTEMKDLSINIDWDWAFEKAQEVNSNSQLYKQAGNSVTVNVISAIAHELD